MSPSRLNSAPYDLTLRALQREVMSALPGGSLQHDDGSLERLPSTDQQPRIALVRVLEGRAFRELPVTGDINPGFAAFLDGTQRTRGLCNWNGIPVMVGDVAAVIRVRTDRRLSTWPVLGPLVERKIYAPRAAIPVAAWNLLETGSVPIADSAQEPRDGVVHPLLHQQRARDLVRADRETLERRLAEAWCTREEAPLCIDGGIAGSSLVAASPQAIGVIKSHYTLYVHGDALATVMGLHRGHRTSVFEVLGGKRTTVASWYLRLRDPAGHDPFWGLVRVECAVIAEAGAMTERADQTSRWVLAEMAPLALPDGRWDKMMYGVRDCEEFLRAIV